MILKNFLLFLIVCGLAGVCILLGSLLGHNLGKVSLFSGALIGGVLGIAAAVWLSLRFRLLDRTNSGVTFVGGVVGFILAAVIAVNNLQGPVIPMASVGLIGLGAVIGTMVGPKQAG